MFYNHVKKSLVHDRISLHLQQNNNFFVALKL